MSKSENVFISPRECHIMESPLNLAHQQSRKADHVIKTGKYEDAIYCHKRAAEHILDAMQRTASTHALESLQLQHQYHLKQQDLILSKQRRAELQQQQQQSNPGKDKEPKDPVCLVSSQGSNPMDIPDSRCGSKRIAGGELSEEQLVSDAENYLVYRTIAETDSLLQYLINRHTDPNSAKHGNKKDLQHSPSVRTLKEIVAAAVKTPKDDKTIIEELRIHNEDLRKHVAMLLKELETCKSEKAQLLIKLDQHEHAQPLYLQGDSADINLPPLELPPLEMPHFDFESLKQEMSNSTSTLAESTK